MEHTRRRAKRFCSPIVEVLEDRALLTAAVLYEVRGTLSEGDHNRPTLTSSFDQLAPASWDRTQGLRIEFACKFRLFS